MTNSNVVSRREYMNAEYDKYRIVLNFARKKNAGKGRKSRDTK